MNQDAFVASRSNPLSYKSPCGDKRRSRTF